MYGIFTNIGPKNHPNVGKYTIHGSSGNDHVSLLGKLTINGHFPQLYVCLPESISPGAMCGTIFRLRFR